jgi:beta-galactosidase GanA
LIAVELSVVIEVLLLLSLQKRGSGMAKLALHNTCHLVDWVLHISRRFPSSHFNVDYQQASFRKYQRLTKSIQPHMDEYKKSVEAWGEDFGAHSLTQGQISEVTQAGVERMAADLEQQYVYVSYRGFFFQRSQGKTCRAIGKWKASHWPCFIIRCNFL